MSDRTIPLDLAPLLLCAFLKLSQLVFTLFLQPNPPLEIPFVAPDFSLLLHPFFFSNSFLSSQILYHWQMVSPNGTVTKLDKPRARQLVAVCAGFETFLFHAALVNVTALLMSQARAVSTRAAAAVAVLVL